MSHGLINKVVSLLPVDHWTDSVAMSARQAKVQKRADNRWPQQQRNAIYIVVHLFMLRRLEPIPDCSYPAPPRFAS